ncbi:MAG: DUF4198 domain-containing protein [Saprospiraceae bacterium]|nr:DUF4198 domain-containing protein [Saprospiraceae bacterium]MDP4821153.1 DUF4198 domain-containing protein [Saprospiraceae bacterium]
MKRFIFLLAGALLLVSHDMYFKLSTYFLSPDTPARIQLYNGTFERSENTIDRNRMVDVSLVGQGQRMVVDTTQWSEEEGVTVLDFTTGAAGTWVAGLSTYARNIELSAADFNDYLEHDGVLDMLVWRKENGAMEQDAVEKYSKHVKTIFQVGEVLTDDWKRVLGYPIEFVPLQNPYDLHPGHLMEVQLLWQGEPLAGQLVHVGSEAKPHDHGDGVAHSHSDLTTYRTDSLGKVAFNVTQEGVWYLRTIYMALSEEAGLTHESNWATLTFEIGEGHSPDHGGAGAHSHGDEALFGLPSYVYWIGSLVLVMGLFFWFNRKKR